MQNEHHALIQEFPEHRDRIHELKISNSRFRALFERYHEIDRQVRRAEDNVEPTTTAHEEELKKERLRLKDELFALLSA